ncbi:hypothetical protein OAS1_25480 [Bacillus sp. YKCMOAS1]|nr:hypothetical protein OAS1_25480 [Bacillus sp. YKCMOAS1]
MWENVYEEFSNLTKSEQLALFNVMKQDLFPDEPDKMTKLLKSIREARFASGLWLRVILYPKLLNALKYKFSPHFIGDIKS